MLERLEAAKAASTAAASTSKRAPPVDKFANYSNAAQLGFAEPGKSQLDIQQEMRSKVGQAGEWETIVEPVAVVTPETEPAEVKRKLGEYDGKDEEEENFKFQHRGKRPVRDVYADDDYDPMAVLGSLKMKVKKENGVATEATDHAISLPVGDGSGGWTGKIELEAGSSGAMRSRGWVKVEDALKPEPDQAAETDQLVEADKAVQDTEEDVKPNLGAQTAENIPVGEDENPDLSADGKSISSATGGLFKKRRPPPGGGRKR